MALPRFLYGDPSKHVDWVRKKRAEYEGQQAEAKAENAKQKLKALFEEPAMTLDQIKQVEELLVVWYEYESAYRPALGAPRISPSCRGYGSSNVHNEGDETDALLNKITAEAVSACVDELPVMLRAAIQVHMRNKVARASVHRNPRVADQVESYDIARDMLWLKFKAKGLIRC